MISDDDATLVILAPSQAMSDLLRDLDLALARVATLPGSSIAPAKASPWEDLALAPFVHEAARLPLLVAGWPEGEIPEGDLATGEVLHELATDSNMMSGEDLEAALRQAVEGAGAAAEWRRITAAESVERLLKNDTAIGWSGFDVMNHDEALRHRLERRRMMVDAFREKLGWQHLRVEDLLAAARLLEKALAAEVVDETKAQRWQARIGGELLMRCNSWTALAQDALLGALWTGLEQSEKVAGEALGRTLTALETLLGESGAWTRSPWPHQATDPELPKVYGF